MPYQVTVIFELGREFIFEFSSAEIEAGTPEEARRWFDREYANLAVAPGSPLGKVLIIDKILDVARYGGVKRFLDDPSWAERFARSAAQALGRNPVRVDVSAYLIAY